jgi:Fe-S-cluster containining protein
MEPPLSIREDDDEGIAKAFLRNPPWRAFLETTMEQITTTVVSSGLTGRTDVVAILGLQAGLCEYAMDLTRTILHGQEACVAGCSWCCHKAVSASAVEILLVAMHLTNEWPPERLAVAQYLAQAQQSRWHALSPRQRVAMRMICPLLDSATGTCEVYDHKPMVCAAHNSTSAAACHAGYDAQWVTGTIPMQLEYTVTIQLIAQHFDQALHRHGIPLGMYHLAGGLAIALAIGAEVALDRWGAGEDLFESVRWPTTTA